MTMTNEEWINFLKLVGTKPVLKETITTSSISIKTKPIEEKSLIDIPLDKLHEFFGNLVLAGFTEDEALVITCSVANGARTV